MRNEILNVVTTFSGCGGSSLGYELANCKVLLSIDFEPNAVKTYKMNFPNTISWQKNIREVTGQMILDAIGMKKGELDILDGSPPCTPFSTSGMREKGWGKPYKHSSESTSQITDDLFFEQIRLIKEIEPKVFLCENVQGMLVGPSKGYFNEILKAMKDIPNYNVRVYKVNAKNFEVAQSRPRLIFIGFRKDIKLPNIGPMPKHHKKISAGEACKGVINSKEDLEIAIKFAQRAIPKKWLKHLKPGQYISEIHPKRSLWNYCRLHKDKPAQTILAGSDGQMYHWSENRSITLAECKRLSSFPDDFKFLNWVDGWIRIGNSVPPNLIKNMCLFIQDILTKQSE